MAAHDQFRVPEHEEEVLVATALLHALQGDGQHDVTNNIMTVINPNLEANVWKQAEYTVNGGQPDTVEVQIQGVAHHQTGHPIHHQPIVTSITPQELSLVPSSSGYTINSTLTEPAQPPALTIKKPRQRPKPAKDYNCMFCGKKFTDSSNLKQHVRIHTGEKPYKCSHCGKGFIQSSNCRLHERTHTGEKPFKCRCGRGFIKSSNLKLHMRTHTKERPYVCLGCQKGFACATDLKRHRKKSQDKGDKNCAEAVHVTPDKPLPEGQSNDAASYADTAIEPPQGAKAEAAKATEDGSKVQSSVKSKKRQLTIRQIQTGFSDIKVTKDEDKIDPITQLQPTNLNNQDLQQQQQLQHQLQLENLQQHQIVINQDGEVLQTIQPLNATPHMLGDQPTIGIGGQLLSYQPVVTTSAADSQIPTTNDVSQPVQVSQPVTASQVSQAVATNQVSQAVATSQLRQALTASQPVTMATNQQVSHHVTLTTSQESQAMISTQPLMMATSQVSQPMTMPSSQSLAMVTSQPMTMQSSHPLGMGVNQMGQAMTASQPVSMGYPPMHGMHPHHHQLLPQHQPQPVPQTQPMTHMQPHNAMSHLMHAAAATNSTYSYQTMVPPQQHHQQLTQQHPQQIQQHQQQQLHQQQQQLSSGLAPMWHDPMASNPMQMIDKPKPSPIKRNHRRRNGIYRCFFCGRNFPDSSNLRQHERTHTGEKPYHCSYCGKGFIQSSNCKLHERTHTGEKPFKCDTCNKTFTKSSNLKLHQRNHTGERPYHCNLCGRSFKCGSELKMHERRVHTMEKPYSCEQCGKNYISSGALKKHQDTHSTQRPFKCLYCYKSFKNQAYLLRHQGVHSLAKPYKCSICDKTFKYIKSVKKHEELHTKPQEIIECPHCDLTFHRRSNRDRHVPTHFKPKPVKSPAKVKPVVEKDKNVDKVKGKVIGKNSDKDTEKVKQSIRKEKNAENAKGKSMVEKNNKSLEKVTEQSKTKENKEPNVTKGLPQKTGKKKKASKKGVEKSPDEMDNKPASKIKNKTKKSGKYKGPGGKIDKADRDQRDDDVNEDINKDMFTEVTSDNEESPAEDDNLPMDKSPIKDPKHIAVIGKNGKIVPPIVKNRTPPIVKNRIDKKLLAKLPAGINPIVEGPLIPVPVKISKVITPSECFA